MTNETNRYKYLVQCLEELQITFGEHQIWTLSEIYKVLNKKIKQTELREERNKYA